MAMGGFGNNNQCGGGMKVQRVIVCTRYGRR